MISFFYHKQLRNHQITTLFKVVIPFLNVFYTKIIVKLLFCRKYLKNRHLHTY